MRKSNKQNLNNTSTTEIKEVPFEIKAYFIDLDGTTLDKIRKNISKKNINALKEKNTTSPVVISTGRSFGKKVKKIMQLINSKYAICQNGAIIGDNQGNILKNIKLESEQINQIVKICKKYKLIFTVNSRFELFTDKKSHIFLKLFLGNKIKKINKFNPDKYDVNKFVLVGKTKKKINRIYEEIKNLVPNTSAKTSGHDYIIEITHKDATKGNGAIFVSKLLNIDPKETIHIGDSQNDTTTLDIVGALIAMKNSSTRLLDVATHIGPSYKRGGIAKVLQGEFEEIKR